MNDPRREHGIEHEPHLANRAWENDPSERSAGGILAREKLRHDELERVEHSVWDEPSLTASGGPAGRTADVSYRSWLERNIAQTSWVDSWAVTLMVALAAGPWGILGAFGSSIWSGGATGIALLAAVVFGPVTEEITKVAVALWVVEKRPYCFRSGGQILFCAACGGLVFAAIENFVYMEFYVPDHTQAFVIFRWTICVALHLVCSSLAGVGLERIWNDAVTNLRRPDLTLGTRWFVAAMVCHGLYNLTVSLAETAGWLDFGLPPQG